MPPIIFARMLMAISIMVGLRGAFIECPLHGARFDVKTGKGVDGPYECDLKKFAVRVVGEEIQVEIPSVPF